MTARNPLERPDSDIMIQVQDGWSDGIGVLYDRHHKTLFGFFLRLTGKRHLSEDLVQEVFVRILRYAPSFRRGSGFKPWFFQIARRVHLDHLGPPEPEVQDPDPLPSTANDQHLDLERKLDQARMERALNCLPKEKRELLLLSRDPDLGHADLAAMFGCTQGALKVRVHRALKDLRSAYFAEGPR